MSAQELRRSIRQSLAAQDLRCVDGTDNFSADTSSRLSSFLQRFAAGLGSTSEELLSKINVQTWATLVQEEYLLLWDSAWPKFLFDESSLVQQRCHACRRTQGRTMPVFAQCHRSPLDGAQFCKQHSHESARARPYGTWGEWQSVQDIPARIRTAAVRLAKQRACFSSSKGASPELDGGFNSCATAGHARNHRLMSRSRQSLAQKGKKQRLPPVEQREYQTGQVPANKTTLLIESSSESRDILTCFREVFR